MPVAPEHAAGGPVYFAWVGPDETAFTEDHIRYDEYILSIEIDLEEGKLPVAQLVMINPGAASWWLAPGRKRWAWLAFADGDTVKPAFFGRILAMPSDMNGETVTVQLFAKPLDYLARKQAAAAALKVLPNYSKTFVDPAYLDDPDTVLKGYSASWHHDPVTHAVSITDYIGGEAGELEFLATDIVYDSLTFALGDPPPRAIKCDATVTYTQKASGIVDIGHNVFSSLTGQNLFENWPKPGASLGSGWTVAASSATDGGASNAYVKEFKFEFKNESKTHENGDAMSVNETISKPMGAQFTVTDFQSNGSFTAGDPDTGRAAALSLQEGATYIVNWDIKTTLSLQYDAARARTEHLIFTLALDSQALLSDDDGTDDIETVTLSGADVGLPLPGEDSPPIGDLSRRSYFPTDRGLQDAAYAINVCRASLLSKARPGEIVLSPTSFSRALAVSCRHTVKAHDARRLPGGVARGKVVNVKISVDGDSQTFLGTITAKGAIGNGGSAAPVAGAPAFADADVLDASVQLFAGRALVLSTGDCAYTLPVDGVNDDGLVFPLTRDQVVVRSETKVSDGPTQQEIVANSSGLTGSPLSSAMSALDLANQADNSATTVASALSAALIWYELELKPVADLSFEYAFEPTVGPLLVAQQINLAGG
jgi:hypothetical protein